MRRILIVMGALSLAACGGSYEAVDQNHTGNLADGAGEMDGHTCDTSEISVGEGWQVAAQMNSEWDNYIILSKGGAEVTHDDDGGEEMNASLTHTVTEAGDYVVHACAYSDGRGAYTLHIATNEGG